MLGVILIIDVCDNEVGFIRFGTAYALAFGGEIWGSVRRCSSCSVLVDGPYVKITALSNSMPTSKAFGKHLIIIRQFLHRNQVATNECWGYARNTNNGLVRSRIMYGHV